MSLLGCHLGAPGERQYHSEPPIQVHCTEIGSIRLGSLFLTLPTRLLTSQHVISSGGWGEQGLELRIRGDRWPSADRAMPSDGVCGAGRPLCRRNHRNR